MNWQGRNDYNIIRMDYEDGRTVLTKHNIMKAMWREYYTALRPLDPPPDRILWWMMQSGKYVPAATWIITAQGQGLSYVQLEAMWDLIKTPEGATLDDVHNLFFYQRGQGWSSGFARNARESEWEISYDEAKAKALAAREQGHNHAPASAAQAVASQFANISDMEASSDDEPASSHDEPAPSMHEADAEGADVHVGSERFTNQPLPPDVLLQLSDDAFTPALLNDQPLMQVQPHYWSNRAFVWVNRALELMLTSNEYQDPPGRDHTLTRADALKLVRRYGWVRYNEYMQADFTQADEDGTNELEEVDDYDSDNDD